MGQAANLQRLRVKVETQTAADPHFAAARGVASVHTVGAREFIQNDIAHVVVAFPRRISCEEHFHNRFAILRQREGFATYINGFSAQANVDYGFARILHGRF